METLEEFEKRVEREANKAIEQIQAAMLKYADGQTLDELWEILMYKGFPVSTAPQPNSYWRQALTQLLYQGKLVLTEDRLIRKSRVSASGDEN